MRQWHRVAAFDELQPGRPVPVKVGRTEVAVYRLGQEVYAIGDLCPHQIGIRLSGGTVEGDSVVCPMHHSRFDIRTGRVLGPPSRESVFRYEVKVEDGVVYVEV